MSRDNTITGTIIGDTTLTSVTAANLSIAGQSGAFNIIDSYSGSVLSVHNTAETFFPSISLFFNSIGVDNLLAAWDAANAAATVAADAQYNFNAAECGGDSSCISTASQELTAALAAIKNRWTPQFAATVDAETTPLPTSLSLFASGLAALGLLTGRKKRKAVAFAA